MSIGFMGDGKPSNNNQPKRPRSVRGYKTKKIVTEHYGRKDVSWERVPRSGYGSAFFSLFTLFLVVLVLFNVVTDAGYDGYKVAVTGLYGITEAFGSVVRYVATTSMDILGIGNNEFGSGGAPSVEDDGAFYVAVKRLGAYRDYYKIILNNEIASDAPDRWFTVVESNYSRVDIGDIFFVSPSLIRGNTVIAYKNGVIEEQELFRWPYAAYGTGHKIKYVSYEEYLEKTKE